MSKLLNFKPKPKEEWDVPKWFEDSIKDNVNTVIINLGLDIRLTTMTEANLKKLGNYLQACDRVTAQIVSETYNHSKELAWCRFRSENPDIKEARLKLDPDRKKILVVPSKS